MFFTQPDPEVTSEYSMTTAYSIDRYLDNREDSNERPHCFWEVVSTFHHITHYRGPHGTVIFHPIVNQLPEYIGKTAIRSFTPQYLYDDPCLTFRTIEELVHKVNQFYSFAGTNYRNTFICMPPITTLYMKFTFSVR
jgi:hypothetical protein